MTNKLASVQDISDKTFDYIVVGGGTAGCVVASRLSEDPNISVAVLEAGPHHLDDPSVKDPMAFLKMIYNEEYDYQYTTTPQPGLGGRQSMSPRGRGLAGTSQINFMMWTIPQREEIEGVGKLGNEGWTWENFHKYQKKVQRFYPPPKDELMEFKSLYNPESVGHDGPMPLIFSSSTSGAEALLQQSLGKHGVDTITTSLDGRVAGTYKNISSIDPKTRQRASAATAYLVPALDRSNLKVLTDCYVRKIVTTGSGEGLVASGVEFEHGGKIYVVSAKREVIVCAGAIKSPQILELSGIGDPKVLQPLGIEVRLELPSVGTNVQEHVTMGFNRLKIRDGQNIITSGMLENPTQAEELRKSLGLSDPIQMVPNAVSFVPIQNVSDRADAIISRQREKFARNASTYPPGLKEQHEIQLQLLEDPDVPDIELVFFPLMIGFFPNPEPEKPYVNLYPMVGRPFSRGTIHVTSADPKENPAFDAHYFEEETDIDIMVDTMKFIRKVVQTEPFSKIVEREELPGPDVQTDEQLYEYARMHSASSWHTCGSNSVLPRDKGGVVDSKFKVHGTQNIRVVDLSVLPLHTAVHPMATVYTLAEMACDIIRARSS